MRYRWERVVRVDRDDFAGRAPPLAGDDRASQAASSELIVT
jgi:hypothetical protein